MKRLNDFFGCEEISNQEMMEINGGQSAAYWFGYVLGKGARFIQGALEDTPDLPSAAEYK